MSLDMRLGRVVSPALILNANQTLLILLPLCVNACVRNGYGLKFAVYEETEMLKFRGVETIHINHLTKQTWELSLDLIVESPECHAKQWSTTQETLVVLNWQKCQVKRLSYNEHFNVLHIIGITLASMLVQNLMRVILLLRNSIAKY